MLQLAGEVVAKLSSLGHVENINKEDQNFILDILYVHNAVPVEYDAISSLYSGYKIIVLLKCYHKPAWRVWIKLYTKTPKAPLFVR